MSEIPRVYANHTDISVSCYDFALDFGQMPIRDRSDERGATEPLVRVLMSPQHAKALSRILAGRITAYEDTFGVIPLADAEAQDEARETA